MIERATLEGRRNVDDLLSEASRGLAEEGQRLDELERRVARLGNPQHLVDRLNDFRADWLKRTGGVRACQRNRQLQVERRLA